jgi:hypothetical protein
MDGKSDMLPIGLRRSIRAVNAIGRDVKRGGRGFLCMSFIVSRC